MNLTTPSPDQLKACCAHHGIHRWDTDKCSICEAPIGYTFQNGRAFFDGGCDCTSIGARLVGWDEVAETHAYHHGAQEFWNKWLITTPMPATPAGSLLQERPAANSMSPEWCASRIRPIRNYLNAVGAPEPARNEWRTWLIELLSQLDNPPASQPLELLGVPPGYVLVPIQADDALLASMAMRSRHDYGLWDEEKQAGARLSMRQVHEEVVGTGFYKLAASPSTIGGSGGWISVDERLPDFGVDVLLIYANLAGKDRQTVGKFAQMGIDEWAAEPQNPWINNYEPTHWQPLPAAPTPSQKAQ